MPRKMHYRITIDMLQTDIREVGWLRQEILDVMTDPLQDGRATVVAQEIDDDIDLEESSHEVQNAG